LSLLRSKTNEFHSTFPFEVWQCCRQFRLLDFSPIPLEGH